MMGIDISQGMIEQAVSSNQGFLSLRYSVMDAENLELPINFDVIVCNSSFQWFQKPEKVLMRCFNVLRQGGESEYRLPIPSCIVRTLLQRERKSVRIRLHERFLNTLKVHSVSSKAKRNTNSYSVVTDLILCIANFGMNQTSSLLNRRIRFINQSRKWLFESVLLHRNFYRRLYKFH
ncbi:predicted protein [Methanosarcina acetivorans C2A]|uniref:Methyltransferase type 11 domain-containing protein n=2 Tax=Methanosarcina acetivorans TaxID=2214 RepID=Q8TLW8_METAC|nr:predicted protein [Methanosarcina acetivorans C2A]